MRFKKSSALASLVGGLLLLAAKTPAAEIGFQARLHGPDAPAFGDIQMSFNVYDSEVGGTPINPQPVIIDALVENHLVSTSLPLEPAWIQGGSRWVGVSINGDEESAHRLPLLASPIAASLDPDCDRLVIGGDGERPPIKMEIRDDQPRIVLNANSGATTPRGYAGFFGLDTFGTALLSLATPQSQSGLWLSGHNGSFYSWEGDPPVRTLEWVGSQKVIRGNGSGQSVFELYVDDFGSGGLDLKSGISQTGMRLSGHNGSGYAWSGSSSNRTIEWNGASGEFTCKVLRVTGGADLAERADVVSIEGVDPRPGMVVALDPSHPGQMTPASTAYDTRVAGVISGARALSPGLILGDESRSDATGEWPIAQTGRVYVLVDEQYGEIQPGDRLTSSPTPGHAMRVDDTNRASGAVIGKAWTTAEDGYVLMLVQPQ